MLWVVSRVELPHYTLAQELWNSISHGLGALFGLIGGGFLIAKAAYSGDPYAIVSSSIFIFCLVVLYTMSCIYHALGRNKGKKVFRVLDHNAVFLLIMGTYAPYCLVTLREYSVAWGWSILALCWALGIVGIVFNSINIKKFAILSMVDYICMGWCVLISFWPLASSLDLTGLFLLIGGGLAYTLGAVLYGLGSKKSQWFHVVFHFFCLIGTFLMFFSIYFYVIP